MSELALVFPGSSSPFEQIKRLGPAGGEYWSARDLMPLLGYDSWRRFADAIDRAMVAARNAGHDTHFHFAGAVKVAASGPNAEDFYLSRYACYLVAMNGDPRKPEIAAAQTYFAIQTHRAELAAAATPALTEDEIVHQALAITARRVGELTARVAELEPKAEFYDEVIDIGDAISWAAAATELGWTRNLMLRELRRQKVLKTFPADMKNVPYAEFLHHFVVSPTMWVNPQTGTEHAARTTWVPRRTLPWLLGRLTDPPGEE